MEYKKYDYDSFQIYTVKTSQFKNCNIEIVLRNDARKIDSPKRVFLTRLLGFNSKKYPTLRALNMAKQDLYNVQYQTGVELQGTVYFTSLMIDFIHPKYVKEQDYLTNCILFLFEMLLNPNMDNKSFAENAYQIVKERLYIDIDHYKENPQSYGLHRCRKILFKDTILENGILGTHEEIATITKEDLYEEYSNLLKDATCEIKVVGNLDMDYVAKKISEIFKKPSIVKLNLPLRIEMPSHVMENIWEEGPFHQTKIFKFYQTNAFTKEEYYFVFPIFKKIISDGGLMDKLGKYLRMDHSLCYSYHLMNSIPESYLYISAGVKKENILEAFKYIDLAMEDMIKGRITNEELINAKNRFAADLKSSEDNIYAIMDDYYYQELFDEPNILITINEMQKVTIQDIQKISKKIIPIYQYVLEEEEKDHERD